MAITTSCFMRCEGCIFNKVGNQEVPFLKIVKTAKELYEEGYRKITLTGGDPLYRKDLKEIVESLYDMGFRIHLDTTGIPLLKDFLLDGLEQKIYLIGIPLDGSTNKIHQIFRTDCPVTITDIKKIIELLDNKGFRISINTVVHSKNICDLQNIYAVLSKYRNVKRWELHQFSPIMSTRRDILVSESDFKTTISKIKNPQRIKISPKLAKQKELNKVILF